jgi:hypothetical protein
MNNFEIWILNMTMIMFSYSLPTSTTTWYSDYCKGPGGYMSGELKSENIKYRKVPHLKKLLSSNKTYNCPIIYNKAQKDIHTLYLTILQYLKDPEDHKGHTTKTLLN